MWLSLKNRQPLWYPVILLDDEHINLSLGVQAKIIVGVKQTDAYCFSNATGSASTPGFSTGGGQWILDGIQADFGGLGYIQSAIFSL